MKIKILALVLTLSTPLLAKDNTRKGLLPEVRLDSTDEKINQKKATQSEVLISKTELKAIRALEGIIKKRKGSPEEASLWDRLGELYMRRAKSGRFFDLFRGQDGPARFAPPEVTSQTAIDNLKKAVQVYAKVEKDFPKYSELDSVLFNYAFASQQLKDVKSAERAYSKLVENFPKSTLTPDSYLALGEMAYDQQKFNLAIERFKQIENFPKSKVFSYGLYKQAWAMYNSKDNQNAIDKLVQVVKINQPGSPQSNHNLRTESLRDLGLFFGESLPPEQAFEFFSKIASKEEVGESLMGLAKLYESHSRHDDLVVFLNDFIKREPWAPQLIKAHSFIIRSYETTKKRSQVLSQLKQANLLCNPQAPWRLKNAPLSDAECDDGLASETREITRKWWDLWQKNKGHKEIAELTQSALEMHLARDNSEKPDAKTRFAYAELLFQLEKYGMASREYETVALISNDSKTKHNSQYAALYSLEKLGDKANPNDVKRLAQLYLQNYPNGSQATQAQFKLGFVAYEEGQLIEALKWLKPLSLVKGTELTLKSQDLVLDIYNTQKDYENIQSQTLEYLKMNGDEKRAASLKKIKEEAEFASNLATKDELAAIEKFKKFYLDNPSSPLAKESLWQAVRLSLTKQDPVSSADLAVFYAEKYPDDKSEKVIALLNDAGKAYTEVGLIKKAAQTFEKLAARSEKSKLKYLQAAAELFDLEGDQTTARKLFREILPLSSPADQGKILWGLREGYKGNSAEVIKIEEQILAKRLQPYSSRIELDRARTAFKQELWTVAFNRAKPLVDPKSGAEENVRAEARLIQAQVLEREFMQTRTKTTLSKLNLILSIKTEKLDTAQTAFLTSAKIATDVNTKMKALEGLRRIYANYVDTVGNPEIKDTLTPADQEALSSELAKLVAPIKAKKLDIEKQILSFTKEENTDLASNIDYDSLSSPAPSFPQFTLQSFPQPKIAPAFTEDLLTAIKTDTKTGRPQFVMALEAEKNGNNFKSLYLTDLALKKDPSNTAYLYQKGRLLWGTDQKAQAYEYFEKAEIAGFKSSTLNLVLARLSYGQKNCLDVLVRLKDVPEEVKKLKLNPLVSECQAQVGEFDSAVKTLSGKNSPEDLLQLARIHEVYRFDTNLALKHYESALSTPVKAEVKDWLARKISSIKDVRVPAGQNNEGANK